MTKKIKNICIYGIGGVGGYFGGKIAHKINTGNYNDLKVSFISRGENLLALHQKGLKLITDDGETTSVPHLSTDNITQIPTPDLYLLCVKGYDLNEAAISISKNISPQTIVLPLLNGIDIYDRVKENLPDTVVLPACVYISSSIEKPAVVRQKGPAGKIFFGQDQEMKNYDYQKINNFFQLMEINASMTENISEIVWEKYIFIAPFSLITAYADKTIGEVMADAELKKITINIIQEVIRIGQAKKIRFKENILENVLKIANNFPFDTKTSFQRDYEKGTGRHEGDIFGGTLIRMSNELQITIPTIEEICTKLNII